VHIVNQGALLQKYPTRRTLIAAMSATAGLLWGAKAVALPFAGGLSGADPALSPALRQKALLALAAHHRSVWSSEVIGVVDFGIASAIPRFHLVDIVKGITTTLLVAHGKGSDPDHRGLLQHFSNDYGSLATSEGAYLTGEAYDGVHGPSRRLLGLDPTNSNAEGRAIVIHAAWYVGPDIVARQGRLGRSDGCFVFSQADIGQVLARLGKGRLIYAGRG
jgi:hypothetical protein